MDNLGTAFAQGSAKLQTRKEEVLQTRAACTDEELRADAAMIGGHQPLLPGMTYIPKGYELSQGNTCLRKPHRDSVEVEAILGKNVYKCKVEPDSPTELRKKMAEQEQKLKEVMAEMRGLATGKTAFREIKDVSELDIKELRTLAKEKEINTFGMSKEKIIEEIRANS